MKNTPALLLKTALSFAFIVMLCINSPFAQVVDISANPSTSPNGTFGANNYAATESIYTEAEIGADNFTSAANAINKIAFNIFAIDSSVTTFNNVTIWMKEVPLTATTFSAGTYTTAGYTQVFAGQVVAASTGWVYINLANPFQRVKGNNLQVLIERSDGVRHSKYNYWTANGNNTGDAVFSTRRYSNVAALSTATVLATSKFRTQIRLQHSYPNDAMVQQIYTLGKLPVPFATPHIVRANIANVGLNALTNIQVTLNVTGANIFTNAQTIPLLAAGANTEVSFASFTPAAQGDNNVAVTLGGDDFNGNNSKSLIQTVNNHTFSYAYGTVPDGSSGIAAAPFTGDFVTRYSTSFNTALSQVSVYFLGGGQPFQIGVWDATGAGGTPGKLLFTSATQTSTTGVYVTPILPALPISTGDFFVGVRQIDVNNIRFAYQTEDPVRTSTFYVTQPTGGTTWADLASLQKYRFMIEPKLQLPIDANLTSIITPSATCKAGSVSYAVVLSNVGLNTINAGAANVTLKIEGVNVYSATVSNPAAIAAGSSATIHFNGISLTNPGTNLVTGFVALTGDTEQGNDTLKTTNSSNPVAAIAAFPVVENVETTLPVLPNFAAVAGSSQLWLIHASNYSNAGQANALMPHGGSKYFLFDSYGGPSSAGFVSRLYSNCVSLPANTSTLCGYKLQFYMSHDTAAVRSKLDSLYVTVSSDNGVTWTRLLPGFQRYDAAYTTPGWQMLQKDLSAYSGQTIQVGFEGVSKYGNAFGLDDITIGSLPSLSLALAPAADNGVALAKQCDDQGWTYYSNPADPGVTLLSINWDPAGTGANAAAKAAAVPAIQVDATYFSAENIAAKKATYTMSRYWNVNVGAAPLASPVNLRFFYDAAEKTAIVNAAAAFATSNTGTLETPSWFKTTTTDFKGNAAHVNADVVLNTIPLTDANAGGNTINGVLYAEFDGITSFSGGTYSTGVGPNTTLPVSLTGFDAKRIGKANQLTWSTSQEFNSSRFVIERSANGSGFASIGEVAASGSSSVMRNYSFSDDNPLRGNNYYRLRMVDIDNSSRYSSIRSVNNAGSVDVAVFPNPARALLSIKLTADKADKAQLVITDMSGKIMLTETLVIARGINLAPVNINKLSAGTYILKITLSDEVVIRNFNKQ